MAMLGACAKQGQEFVEEYFDQNPLSHLGVIALRNASAERLSELSGNKMAHLEVNMFGLMGPTQW